MVSGEAAVLCGDEAAVIDVQGLGKVYETAGSKGPKRLWALKEVSLRVGPGRIVGLVGPNGAGKTTFIRLAAGISHPSEGEVSICGRSSRSLEAKRRLGYMPEYPGFLGMYTPEAVLRYHGALLGLSRSRVRSETVRLLGQLELEEATRPSYTFSQGMKQRLSLAMALMGDPSVLLLDEPSNGLDPIGIVKLRELLTALRDEGKTILVSSHRLGELDRLTRHFIFLSKGRLVNPDDAKASTDERPLKVGLLSGGVEFAAALGVRFPVLEASDQLVVLAVKAVEDVAAVVSEAVGNGLAVTEVTFQKEHIEDVFVRLYRNGEAP